jgi:hypothetical protein
MRVVHVAQCLQLVLHGAGPFFHTEESWSRRPHYGEIVRRYDAMVLATEHERRFVESLTTDGPRLHVVGVGVTPVVGVMDAVASLYDALVEGRRRRAMLPPP